MRALILGIGGQDGSYLAEILLDRGYTVYGLYHRNSIDPTRRIKHLLDQVTLIPGDITDVVSVVKAIQIAMPHVIFNEACQDNVRWSYDTPAVSFDVTAKGAATLFEAVAEIDNTIRVFQPASSTMFGDAPPAQDENTPFNPLSPYACAKVAAYYTARYYRQERGIFIATGILFNHDSPRRSKGYLLRELCEKALAARKTGVIEVSDLAMPIDVGFARDYMAGVCDMMLLDEPGDYVLSSGVSYTVGELAKLAGKILGLDVSIKTNAKHGGNGRLFLQGNPARARREFGFNPTTSIESLMQHIMEQVQCESE